MSEHPAGTQQDYVTMTVNGQLFGIPVLTVQDVWARQRMTHIPLAPLEVSGALNLRGRIVTAVEVRSCLGLPEQAEGATCMSVVVEHRGELYSLIVDAVGEVLSLTTDTYEANPATLDDRLKELSNGIYRLDGTLLVVLDVARLLEFDRREAA